MKKKYVKVTAEFLPNGVIVPRLVEWDNGEVFEVQKVFEAVRAASLKAGGTGIRYRCLIEGKERHLFLEDYETADSIIGAKFFVETKN